MQWFRGELVLKAHRLWDQSTLELRVIIKMRRREVGFRGTVWACAEFIWKGANGSKNRPNDAYPARSRVPGYYEPCSERVRVCQLEKCRQLQELFFDVCRVMDRRIRCPLSSELGTQKTVNARFWPWLSGTSPSTLLSCCLFARQRGEHTCILSGGLVGLALRVHYWHGRARVQERAYLEAYGRALQGPVLST